MCYHTIKQIKYTVNQSLITHILVDSSTFYICICYLLSTCLCLTPICSQLKKAWLPICTWEFVHNRVGTVVVLVRMMPVKWFQRPSTKSMAYEFRNSILRNPLGHTNSENLISWPPLPCDGFLDFAKASVTFTDEIAKVFFVIFGGHKSFSWGH